jgi:hypothetical protein
MIGKFIVDTLVAVILAAVVVSIPDIKRYLVIRSM